MNWKKLVSFLGSLALSFGFAYAAVAQQCSHAEGEPWVDSYGYIWVVSQSGSSISGSVIVPMCPGPPPQFFLSGSASNGQVDVTAINNWWEPDGPCALWFRYQGAIFAPGCDAGAGTWTNPNPSSGNWSWGKECDVPSGEVSEFVEWSPIQGQQTAGRFKGILSGGSGPNFGGRTVREDTEPGGVDSCWFPGSIYPPQTNISDPGSETNIGTDNKYTGYDTFGWTEVPVLYYRSANRAPCQATPLQQMQIACTEGFEDYAVNLMAARIHLNNVVCTEREGDAECKTWP